MAEEGRMCGSAPACQEVCEAWFGVALAAAAAAAAVFTHISPHLEWPKRCWLVLPKLASAG